MRVSKLLFCTSTLVFILSISGGYANAADKDTKKTPTIQITGDKPEDEDFGYIETRGDPLEPVNRGMFAFNEAIDNAILEPIARGYKKVVPEWGRERIGNFLGNLSEPVTFANSLLQGDIDNALTSFWRFFVNTTIGVGGLSDQAEAVGLPSRKEDFGQTVGSYGAEGGPYIVLPLLGSTNIRDTVGLAVDSVINPFNYVAGAAVAGRAVTEGVHDRSEVLELTDEIDRTAFDPYSTYRSAYTQRRNSQISNGNVDGKPLK